MSIVTRFLTVVVEPQFKLARDLMAMAIADGKITPEEQRALSTVCDIEGIDKAQLIDRLKSYDSVDNEMPATRKEKECYLRELIRIIGADEHCAPEEVYIFQIIASKMELNQMDVMGLFLLTATHRYFQGNIGQKVLASFLSSVIDPKGKKVQENNDNLRRMYETIAMNTEPQADEEANRKRLSQNLQYATEVLLENKILRTEYRHIGIDFAKCLKDIELSVYHDYAE